MKLCIENIIPTIKYFILTVKHKYFVFVIGLKIKVPVWRLINHDLSKFYLSELPHYGRQFFGKKDDSYGFIKCWLHHQNRNDHHWEYWIPRTGHNRCVPSYSDNLPIPMDKNAVKEMVADWIGASRAYEKVWPKRNQWKWLENNFYAIILHIETREYIEELLSKALPE